MTPELIAILAMSATLAGLMVAIWRDARAHADRGLAELRADNQRLRQEARADNQRLRQDARADMASFRAEIRADMQNLRTEVRADLAEVKFDVAGLRKDVQALTERTSRIEGVIEGVFSGRDRRNDAA